MELLTAELQTEQEGPPSLLRSLNSGKSFHSGNRRDDIFLDKASQEMSVLQHRAAGKAPYSPGGASMAGIYTPFTMRCQDWLLLAFPDVQ